MNKPIGPTSLNYQRDSPTQIPPQATMTSNHPIRFTHLVCPAAPASLYANQPYVSSSNEQSSPLAYPSHSQENTISPDDIRPSHYPPAWSCRVWSASARNKSNSIATASEHETYPDRASQPTPVSTSLTAGIFVLVFLIRCVITRDCEYGCCAYSLLSLMY
jgi:hypothetical protein